MTAHLVSSRTHDSAVLTLAGVIIDDSPNDVQRALYNPVLQKDTACMADPKMTAMPKNMLVFGQLFDVFSSRAEATPRLKHTVPESTRIRIVMWRQGVFGNKRDCQSMRQEAETV